MGFDHLEIADPRERRLVAAADAALSAMSWPIRRRAAVGAPGRILLLRLERIGDLLMSLGAIRAVRRLAPDAAIHLVVGSWNREVAATIAEVDTIETLDAPWLARGHAAASALALGRRALRWRRGRYDLAINFEGDIRSHLLMAASGAAVRVGFDMAGGGPVLTQPVRHDRRAHTASNALRLVERAFGLPEGTLPRPPDPGAVEDWRLRVPDAAARAGAAVLGEAGGPFIAVHAPGGREIKQWPPDRFAEAARQLAIQYDATIVLTGAPADRPMIEAVAAALGRDVRVLDLGGRLDLLVLAAVLARCAAILTGDTGPMHLAAAVGTPVAAVFGPSDPARYAPLVAHRRILRTDLPCAPCNRIRLPPERCQGHTPDCLAGVAVREVVAAASALIGDRRTAGSR